MKTGVYIHIPFCEGRCDYCGFYSVNANSYPPEIFTRYVEKLICEIDARLSGLPGLKVDTIYFGGGTPSIFPAGYISSIVRRVASLSDLDSSAEITIEANPGHLFPEKIDALIEGGINRFVAGVQSFDSEFLKLIGRPAGRDNRGFIEDLFSRNNISRSLDLICGSSSEVCISDAREALRLAPDHISLYMLSIEDNTPLRNRLFADDIFEKGQRDAFEAAASVLKQGGYDHYEISNFSLKGRVSKHNLKYWLSDSYLGFGPSAHSFYGGQRYSNNIDLDRYISAEVHTPEFDIRSDNQVLAEYIMTSLRLLDGFSLSSIYEKLKLQAPPALVEKIPALKCEGYLYDLPDDRLKLTWKGVLWSDFVVYELVEVLL